MDYVSSTLRPANLGDRYLLLLWGVVLGYAFIGKGFAYLGFPPLYIGEIALLTGFIIFLRTSCLIAALASLPSLFLAAAMAWVMLRTLPFVGMYGFDALRDSVVIMYGGFAFIIIALLLEDPHRINTIVRCYGGFSKIYVLAIPFIFAFNHFMENYIPNVPGTDVPLILIAPSELGTHLAGAAVFAVVGFRKATPPWIALLVAALAMVCAQSRGGMLAFAVPVTFAALVLGKIRELAIVLVAGLGIFAVAYVLEPIFTHYRETASSIERPISTRQIVNNIVSIAGEGQEQTEGTKEWRVEWWNVIVNNTVYGPYFWTGRGFGLNLAEAAGISDNHRLTRPLRSPHNVHMTILARAGVPGLALWGAFLASWLGMMMRTMWIARRRGQTDWAALFLFIACYVMAIVINATFDVTLEAPVQGVWFWCLIGFGIGSVMVYRAQHHEPVWRGFRVTAS
ncbi:O-antigen ligase family protein [Bradyrhizobium sp. ISRA443]|uniref:O-antigen ligase family protein n=1 Tax=unclassified Bradyrhizobium TaxID=2631580 RepID=UPI00247A3917|nr:MULTISPECIES: O-antigen ligase family protein [unclassified Bradyrhizobium]WGS01442.1 O-antigen ligase family protein [Bradyrhizobium sp. ISRA436]WGS08329.1 O-antigen ligase family protein [Bradyrhizobium sp. ISRA437]WGS15217.1 O-antigen ligase family protein [Bradyrhizobium sp. ISRA443]